MTDITYIRTREGWLYLAVVLDLFSRQVIGWSMRSRMDSDLALRALLMAVWRRKPAQEVMVHSDQGSHQFTSDAWQRVTIAGVRHISGQSPVVAGRNGAPRPTDAIIGLFRGTIG